MYGPFRSQTAYGIACAIFFGVPVIPLGISTLYALDFALQGEFAQAVVTDREPYIPTNVNGRSGSASHPLAGPTASMVEFQFTDSLGERRTDKTYYWVNDPATPRIGEAIAIQYLPGPGGITRRLVGGNISDIFSVLGFGALVSFDLWLFYYAYLR
jgi:hypothetical protein